MMGPTLWSVRGTPSGTDGKEDALRRRAAWLTLKAAQERTPSSSGSQKCSDVLSVLYASSL